MTSRPSGENVTTIHPDGTHESRFRIHQNGRGPEVTTRLTLAADGTIATFDAKGHDEMGKSVAEHFERTGSHVKWKGLAESGDKEVSSPAFYVPLSPSLEVIALLADAAERAGGKIALLPGGEARLKKTGEAVAKGASGERRIVAWSLTGVELSPTRFWRDEAGAFWGVTDSFFACVPEGFEGAIEDLAEVQRKLQRRDEEETAKKLAHHPPKAGVAFTHVRVLDVEKKKYLADQTVLVEDKTIKAIGPAKTTKVPGGVEVVDGAGKTLIPGLWDMHAHLGQATGELDVASGVTTARDLGNDPDQLDDYKKRFDDGTAIGPHLLRSGFIEGRGENAAASKVTAETEAEAKAAVELFAKRGYEGIKIYNSMKKELVPVLAKAAHDRGMRVSGHVPVHMRAEDVVRAGYDEIQHVNMLFLNFFIDEKTDTRTPLRFSIVAERGASLDLAGKPVKDFVALLLAKKTVVDPTLNAFENLFADRLGEQSRSIALVADRLPVQLRRQYLTGGIPVPDGKDQTFKDSFKATQKMVKLLFDAGVPIVAGTDSLPGIMLHRELELYAEAGLSNADVLAIATIGSARVMKLDKKTGSIAVGKVADFALVDGDPLAKISDLRRVVTVVRDGVVFSSADVYESVGVGRAK